MVNALAAGQVLAEFRGHSPADRDRLVQALGDRAVVLESPWVCSLVVSFNTKKKPFDDPRVRQALSLAIDRWAGAQALQKIALVRHVGGLLRPGYDLAISEQDLVKLPGFCARHQRVARRGTPAAEGGRGREPDLQADQPQRGDAVHAGRRVPDRPVAPDRAQRAARAARDAAVPGRAAARQPDLRRGARFQLRLHGRAQPAAAEVPVGATGRRSTTRATSTASWTTSTTSRRASSTGASASRCCASSSASALEQAYVIPTIWWHRIIVHHKQMKGWHITPSHYVGQDLTDVWLDR